MTVRNVAHYRNHPNDNRNSTPLEENNGAALSSSTTAQFDSDKQFHIITQPMDSQQSHLQPDDNVRHTRSSLLRRGTPKSSVLDASMLMNINALFEDLDKYRSIYANVNNNTEAVSRSNRVAYDHLNSTNEPRLLTQGTSSDLEFETEVSMSMTSYSYGGGTYSYPMSQNSPNKPSHIFTLGGRPQSPAPAPNSNSVPVMKYQTWATCISGILDRSGMRTWKCLIPQIDYPLPQEYHIRFNPHSLTSKTFFSPAEDDLILRGVITLGEDWAKIRAELLPSKDEQLLCFRYAQMTGPQGREDSKFKRYAFR